MTSTLQDVPQLDAKPVPPTCNACNVDSKRENVLERIDDTVQDRSLFVLAAPDIDGLAALSSLPCRHFVGLIAWDADPADIPAISRVAEALLDAGAVYIATWGRACELVHDVADETIVARKVMSGAETPLVMTTWHFQESLIHALWFITFAAAPDDAYLQTCAATVAISIGSTERATQMRDAFNDLASFNTAALAESNQ